MRRRLPVAFQFRERCGDSDGVSTDNREAVSTSSPTLPGFGGYVGSRDTTRRNLSGLCQLKSDITQGSRNGNPGLEVETASRLWVLTSFRVRRERLILT